MMTSPKKLIVLCITAILISGCQSQPTAVTLPSEVPMAVATLTATDIPAPTATNTPPPTATVTPPPTVTDAPSPTVTATSLPTATNVPSLAHPLELVRWPFGSISYLAWSKDGSQCVAKVANLANPDIAVQIIREIEALGPSNEPIGVVGGPPCQYFSNGNTSERKVKDERRLLPRRYAKILRKLNEKYRIDFFIFENVDGLTKPKHANDFEKILKLFDDAGFYVKSEVLDAYNFNVPQHRKRVFIIGWNKKLYPEKTYVFPSGNPCNLTVREVIFGLPTPAFFKKNLIPEEFLAHPNHWTMVPHSPKFNTPAPEGLKKTVRSFRRLEWDQPSYTVAYGHNEIHIHPDGARRLSIYEAMLLQGFPSGARGYRLVGGLSEQVSLISDAVPPPLAAALAKSIKEFIQTHRKADVSPR